MPEDRSRVQDELDRVGGSFRKAGTRDYISVQQGVNEVKLLGPPRELRAGRGSGRNGRRSSCSPLYRDDAGVEAVWRALGS